MKQLAKCNVIDLPKSHYRVLNAPAPPRWAVVLTVVTIVAVALLWAVGG